MSKVALKVKYFMWRLIQKCLPVKVNLREKGVDMEAACAVCGNQDETFEHVFFSCSFSKAVWATVFPDLQVQRNINADYVKYWEEFLLALESKQDLEKGLYTLWLIWSNRNDCVHNFKCRNATNLGMLSTKYAEDFQGL